jgi:hypothetical protein
MAIQLTNEPEERIQPVVKPIAHTSTEEALDAALAMAETAAAPGFEGAQEELKELPFEGFSETFWNRMTVETGITSWPGRAFDSGTLSSRSLP